MTTEHLADLLHDLPPQLTHPTDRFDQVRRRARRRQRRRSSTLVMLAAGAVAAVAMWPGVGVEENSAVDRGPAAIPTERPEDPAPGSTLVTELGPPVTTTGTGTQMVDLGPRPAGATAVGVKLSCLSVGKFVLPDGGSMRCDLPPDPTQDPNVAEMTIGAPRGTSVTLRTTPADATWSITTTYIRTQITAWGVNAHGDTYGIQNTSGTPDLVAARATNGQDGYVYSDELDEPAPTSPADALDQQERDQGRVRTVPVYLSDGETQIGRFLSGGSS